MDKKLALSDELSAAAPSFRRPAARYAPPRAIAASTFFMPSAGPLVKETGDSLSRPYISILLSLRLASCRGDGAPQEDARHLLPVSLRVGDIARQPVADIGFDCLSRRV